MMKLLRHAGLVAVLSVFLCAFFIRNASALFPVMDGGTIFQAVFNTGKMLFESKITAESHRLAGKINSTIGNSPFDPHDIFEKNVIKGGDDGDYGSDD